MWAALTTDQADFAVVAGRARRYRPDVSLFYAVDALDDGAWNDVAALAGPGGAALLVSPDRYDIPAGWTDVLTLEGAQMVAERLVAPPGDATIRPLTTDDVPAMLGLIEVARPGPFSAGTVELGGYVGVFDGDDLVAMAGERMRFTGWTEVSAVATHPDARRRGLGAFLTHHVARRIADSGGTPFLHVAAGNNAAERVYERLGFVTRRMMTFRVVRPPAEIA
ncbi:MAG TPA: GNAT family N-acetyltransferase [Acidimicrobiales bacterium]